MHEVTPDARGAELKAVESTARLFFALWPGDPVRLALAEAAERIQAVYGGRTTRTASLHMTLVFLGEAPLARLDELLELAASVYFPEFAMALDTTGCWRQNRIAWLSPRLIPTALNELVTKLETALKARKFRFDDRRVFSPHVTLVRKADCGAGLTNLGAIEWRVDRFVLARSSSARSGAEYHVVGSWSCNDPIPSAETTGVQR